MEQLAHQFAAAMQTRITQHTPVVEVLPTLVSQAWVDVLPVAGAGISLLSEIRVPLGFSDDRARYVEQLQITYGDGPCLESMRSGEPVALAVDQLEERWPSFTADLTSQTGYRSVVSVPIGLPGSDPVAALDLYATSTAPAPALTDPGIAAAVQRITATYLFAPQPGATVGEGAAPSGSGTWLDVVATHPRLQVWQVVGQVLAHTSLGSVDALAVVRSYAYSHNLTLDQLVELVDSGQLDISAVTRT